VTEPFDVVCVMDSWWRSCVNVGVNRFLHAKEKMIVNDESVEGRKGRKGSALLALEH
jgi:hypothetical protein